jgi:tRNA 2-thiouridine synthesizing protein E
MATIKVKGVAYEVNEEGFLVDPTTWTKEYAVEAAKAEGIEELTEAHWKVINFGRESAAASGGVSPTLRTITDGAGITTKDLFALFPKGPAKKVAKIAGLKKPEGCV